MPKAPLNCHKPGKEPKQIGKSHPNFEEAVNFYIGNKADRERAIAFAKWLKEYDVNLTSGGGYNWYLDLYYIDNEQSKDDYFFKLGKYHACYIKLYYDTWHVFPAMDILEMLLFHKELKEVLWESVFPCNDCDNGCYKSPDAVIYRKLICEREYVGKEICTKTPICLSNPKGKTLKVLKQILLNRFYSNELFIDYGMSIDNYTIKSKGEIHGK